MKSTVYLYAYDKAIDNDFLYKTIKNYTFFDRIDNVSYSSHDVCEDEKEHLIKHHHRTQQVSTLVTIMPPPITQHAMTWNHKPL